MTSVLFYLFCRPTICTVESSPVLLLWTGEHFLYRQHVPEAVRTPAFLVFNTWFQCSPKLMWTGSVTDRIKTTTEMKREKQNPAISKEVFFWHSWKSHCLEVIRSGQRLTRQRHLWLLNRLLAGTYFLLSRLGYWIYMRWSHLSCMWNAITNGSLL